MNDVIASPGRALDLSTRNLMERRLSHDFGAVRVHDDTTASRSARAVNALAYTAGRDVVFDAGRYAPFTSEGRALLAHELAHTVQQGSAQAHGTLRIATNGAAETEAAHAAHSTMGAGEAPTLSSTSPAVARQQDAGVPDAVRGTQVDCVSRLGGCSHRLPGGIPTDAQIALYNQECRGETGYAGDDVTPTDEECLYGGAMPPRARNLTVLDWGENWNGFNFMGGFLTLGEIDVSGVRDMVDRIRDSFAPVSPTQPECLGELTIIGHGGPGAISVGGGTVLTPGRVIDGGAIDPKSPAYDPVMRSTLAELTPLFCGSGTVVLRGCNVGDGARGAAFVHQLADLWGVTVRAHVGVISGGGYSDTGRWTTASPTPPAAVPPPAAGP